MSQVFGKKEEFLKAVYERPEPLNSYDCCPGYVFNVVGRHIASIGEERFITKIEDQLKRGQSLTDDQYKSLVSVRLYVLQRYFDYLLACKVQCLSPVASEVCDSILRKGINVTSLQRQEMLKVCANHKDEFGEYTAEAICIPFDELTKAL